MLSRRSEACLRRVVAAAGAALLIAGLAGCASTSSFKAGLEAERAEDFDRAVVEYEKALRAKPDHLTTRLSLQRAKLRAAAYHDQRARRLAGTGKLEEALIELQIAAELNPASGDIDNRLRELRSQLRAKLAVRTDGKTRLQALVESAAELQPAGLELPTDVILADSLVFRNASVRDILTAIGHFADINVIFDPQFRDQTVTVDLRKTSLEDALQAVTSSTRNFYKISAAKTITVIPDTPAKRREYEDEIIRTFFLSNADVKETLDLLRLVVDNRRLSPVAGVNAIAIKDTPDKIAAAGRVIRAIDKARAEVVIDVELLEVDRAKLHEYGLQLASPGSPGISGSVDANRPNLTLSDLGALTTSDVFVTGLPGLYYRLIKTDGTSRTLANPHLRTADGLPSSARFGEDVPVPTVTFAPIASGGVNQQPITVVHLPDHRRQHRDHAAAAPRRRHLAAPEARSEQPLGRRLPEPADVRHALHRDDDPPARRRDEHAGRPDPRRRADDAGRDRRAERPPDHRPPVRPHEERDQADRHRADADAADRPRARPRRRRPAPVPGRPRLERRRLRAAAARAAAAAASPAAGRRCRAGRHLPAGVDADRTSGPDPAADQPADHASAGDAAHDAADDASAAVT